MATDMEVARAIEQHRVRHYKQFILPQDCSDADAKRFTAEIREKHPIHGLIIVRYIAPADGGGLLFPDGRELDPDETWVES